MPHLVTPTLATKRILVVDDDPSLRDVIRRGIEDRGWICDEAFNGVDSISRARINPPDLIILDLAMPVMNGYEASLTLRREFPNVLIVFLSMYADVVGRTSARVLDVHAIAAKSDGVMSLMRRVEKLLATRASSN